MAQKAGGKKAKSPRRESVSKAVGQIEKVGNTGGPQRGIVRASHGVAWRLRVLAQARRSGKLTPHHKSSSLMEAALQWQNLIQGLMISINLPNSRRRERREEKILSEMRKANEVQRKLA